MTGPLTPAQVVAMQVGQRLGYLRSRVKGITQQMLADRVGKSKSWVDKVERGERRLERLSVLYELADALGVGVELLTARNAADLPSLNPAEGVPATESAGGVV